MPLSPAEMQRNHETLWRRADGTMVKIADMPTQEIRAAYKRMAARIDEEENKLITNPAYEQPQQAAKVRQLIVTSKEKLGFLKNEVKQRGESI